MTKQPWEMSLVEYAKSQLAKHYPQLALQVTENYQAKSYKAQYLKDMQAWQASGKTIFIDKTED